MSTEKAQVTPGSCFITPLDRIRLLILVVVVIATPKQNLNNNFW